MTDRKKPGVAFWATLAVIVVLVGYPLSFGPACWATSRSNLGAALPPEIYRPMTWAMSRNHRFIECWTRMLDWVQRPTGNGSTLTGR